LEAGYLSLKGPVALIYVFALRCLYFKIFRTFNILFFYGSSLFLFGFLSNWRINDCNVPRTYPINYYCFLSGSWAADNN